jgi:transposase InsO family protein
MLSPEQISQIPRTTRNDWDRFNHKDYFGFDMARGYIADFDFMKDVLVSKHLKMAMKVLCAMSYGYKDLLSGIEGSQKLLRNHVQNITFSIERLARYGNLKLSDASILFGVSRDWFYRYRERKTCAKSTIGKCFKQYPNQLTPEEVKAIQSIVLDPENRTKTKTTLFYDSIRKGLIYCGRSTFSKYASFVGYVKFKKLKKEDRAKGFKATRPFEWLHVDVTHVQTTIDGVQYVAFIKDNFSGALLGYRSTPYKPDSSFIRDLFVQVFIEYNLLDSSDTINILSDGGSENKGSLIEWLNQLVAPPIIRKLTAKTDEFPFSNSMSESTHSIYKTEFMQGKLSFDVRQHEKDLDQFMFYYNHKRYLFRNYGLTTMEVLYGQIPNKQRFRNQIQEGRIDRIEKNRAINQCPMICQ